MGNGQLYVQAARSLGLAPWGRMLWAFVCPEQLKCLKQQMKQDGSSASVLPPRRYRQVQAGAGDGVHRSKRATRWLSAKEHCFASGSGAARAVSAKPITGRRISARRISARGGSARAAAASPSGSPKQATGAIGNISAAPRSMNLKERTKCQASLRWSSTDWDIGALA